MPTKKKGLKKLKAAIRRRRTGLRGFSNGGGMYPIRGGRYSRHGGGGGGTPYYLHQPVYIEKVREPTLKEDIRQKKDIVEEAGGLVNAVYKVGLGAKGIVALGAVGVAGAGAAVHKYRRWKDPKGAAKAEQDIKNAEAAGILESKIASVPVMVDTFAKAAGPATTKVLNTVAGGLDAVVGTAKNITLGAAEEIVDASKKLGTSLKESVLGKPESPQDYAARLVEEGYIKDGSPPIQGGINVSIPILEPDDRNFLKRTLQDFAIDAWRPSDETVAEYNRQLKEAGYEPVSNVEYATATFRAKLKDVETPAVNPAKAAQSDDWVHSSTPQPAEGPSNLGRAGALIGGAYVLGKYGYEAVQAAHTIGRVIGYI